MKRSIEKILIVAGHFEAVLRASNEGEILRQNMALLDNRVLDGDMAEQRDLASIWARNSAQHVKVR